MARTTIARSSELESNRPVADQRRKIRSRTRKKIRARTTESRERGSLPEGSNETSQVNRAASGRPAHCGECTTEGHSGSGWKRKTEIGCCENGTGRGRPVKREALLLSGAVLLCTESRHWTEQLQMIGKDESDEPWTGEASCYRFITLLLTMTGGPFALNIGPRTDTVLPTPMAATFATSSNIVCEEVLTVIDEKPADVIMPGKP